MIQHGPKMAKNDPKWPKYDPKWRQKDQNGPIPLNTSMKNFYKSVTCLRLAVLKLLLNRTATTYAGSLFKVLLKFIQPHIFPFCIFPSEASHFHFVKKQMTCMSYPDSIPSWAASIRCSPARALWAQI